MGKGCSNAKKAIVARIGVYEIFILDESVHNLIYQQADASVIRRRAIQLGMRTLREDGFRKAAAGITTSRSCELPWNT